MENDVTLPKVESPAMPWLMPAVIEWLHDLLSHGGDVVLETGSGGSTVFFAHRCFRLVSYEHDAGWAINVNKEISRLELAQTIDYRFRPEYPKAGLSDLPELDVALIDGRGRVRSVIDALPRLKPGGWLILDDAGRERYREAVRVMDEACSARIEFRCPPWTPEVWTMAWRKA